METKEKKDLTLNQYNIVGKKLDVDFELIREYKNLEELTLKNFDINDELIMRINEVEKLNSIFLVNCRINSNVNFSNITTLEMVNCIFQKSIYSSNIEKLYIDSCNKIDINEICNLNLKALRLENTKVQNLSKISELIELKILSLNEIYINENINFEKLSNLKRLNLDGSIVENKESFMEQFKGKSIEISFTKENKRIG